MTSKKDPAASGTNPFPQEPASHPKTDRARDVANYLRSQIDTTGAAAADGNIDPDAPERAEFTFSPYGWDVFWEISGVAPSLEVINQGLKDLGVNIKPQKISRELALDRATERWVRSLITKGKLPALVQRGYDNRFMDSDPDAETNLTRLEKIKLPGVSWNFVMVHSKNSQQVTIKADTGWRVCLDKKSNRVYVTNDPTGDLDLTAPNINQRIDWEQSAELQVSYDFYLRHMLASDIGILLSKILLAAPFRAFKGRRTGGVYVVLDKHRVELHKLRDVVEKSWLVPNAQYARQFEGIYSYFITNPLSDTWGVKKSFAKAAANEMTRNLTELIKEAASIDLDKVDAADEDTKVFGKTKADLLRDKLDRQVARCNELEELLTEYQMVFGTSFNSKPLNRALRQVRHQLRNYYGAVLGENPVPFVDDDEDAVVAAAPGVNAA